MFGKRSMALLIKLYKIEKRNQTIRSLQTYIYSSASHRLIHYSRSYLYKSSKA